MNTKVLRKTEEEKKHLLLMVQNQLNTLLNSNYQLVFGRRAF
ncbi:hypothetical protein [Gracilibacillus xinjiangensis]|uniref:Uncharacterized protein n=1 Tax=Gracilibacillus xinjiangensis TaxID=1193282 RepID=A0ABV8WYD4_9BACI